MLNGLTLTSEVTILANGGATTEEEGTASLTIQDLALQISASVSVIVHTSPI